MSSWSRKPNRAPETRRSSRRRSSYDELDRLRVTTDSLLHPREYTYDSRNNRIKTIDALGNRTINAYDDLDRLIRVDRELRVGGTGDGEIDTSNPANPDGLITTQIEYDDNGNVTARVEDDKGVCAGGCQIAFSYDDLDRLIEETYPATPEYPAGTVRTFVYDGADNVVQVTDQNGTVVDNTYDLLNRLTAVAVARAVGVGGTTVQTFAYDGLSRMTFAYDDNDPADPADDHTVTWTYDSLSNPRTETHDGSYLVASEHDGVGFRTKLTYPGGREIYFTPDVLDRIETVCDGVPTCSGADRIAQFAYVGPARVLSRTHGNGTTMEIEYDGDRRIMQIQHTAPGGSADINAIAYAYDDEDNRTQKIETRLERPDSIRRDYVYDSAYRLLEETDLEGGPPEQLPLTYTYDGVGNRTESTVGPEVTPYQADAMNQYTAVDGTWRTHDANGNLTRTATKGDANCDGLIDGFDIDPFVLALTQGQAAWEAQYGGLGCGFLAVNDINCDGAVNAFDIDPFVAVLTGQPTPLLAGITYDFRNRLIEYANLDTGVATKYEYDATGRRVAKTVDPGGPAETYTRYLCDASETIEERDAAGEVLATCVYSNKIDDVLRMDRNGEAYTYHPDALGTITHVTDAGGAVAERYEYDAFGTLTVASFAQSPDGVSAYVSDQDPGGGGDTQLIADDFSFDRPTRIVGLRWWGGYGFGAVPASDDFSIRIFENDAESGQPGELLYEAHLGDAPVRHATGRILEVGVPEYAYELMLAEPFEAQPATTYWLCVVNDTAGEPAVWGWGSSVDGNLSLWFSQDEGALWEQYAGDTAFELFTDESAIGNPITYTGRWQDAESNLYFYRARYYDPTTGRFLARDPEGFVDGMNLYTYVDNNPSNLVDPTGQSWFWEAVVMGAAAVEFVGGVAVGAADALSFGAASAIAETTAQTVYGEGSYAKVEASGAYRAGHTTGEVAGQLYDVASGAGVVKGAAKKLFRAGAKRAMGERIAERIAKRLEKGLGGRGKNIRDLRRQLRKAAQLEREANRKLAEEVLKRMLGEIEKRLLEELKKQEQLKKQKLEGQAPNAPRRPETDIIPLPGPEKTGGDSKTTTPTSEAVQSQAQDGASSSGSYEVVDTTGQ